MAIGTVRWFDVPKGYGFIKPDDGGFDVLVDICALERADLPAWIKASDSVSKSCAMRGPVDRAQRIPAFLGPDRRRCYRGGDPDEARDRRELIRQARKLAEEIASIDFSVFAASSSARVSGRFRPRLRSTRAGSRRGESFARSDKLAL